MGQFFDMDMAHIKLDSINPGLDSSNPLLASLLYILFCYQKQRGRLHVVRALTKHF